MKTKAEIFAAAREQLQEIWVPLYNAAEKFPKGSPLREVADLVEDAIYRARNDVEQRQKDVEEAAKEAVADYIVEVAE